MSFFSSPPLSPLSEAKASPSSHHHPKNTINSDRLPAARLSNRRRALSIIGAVGAQLLTWPTNSVMAVTKKPTSSVHRWRGQAFGTNASLLLHGLPKPAAQSLIQKCQQEISRYEKIFSLYDHNSALARLNKDSQLTTPPKELVDLLKICTDFSVATDGAFDVTVQPLWNLYARHFAAPKKSGPRPCSEHIQYVLNKVDYTSVEITAKRIRFSRPDMMITLNGIAQGYITDQIVQIMRDHGIQNVLVDVGEISGVGKHMNNRPWNIGVRDPARPEKIEREIRLTNEAMSTSGGYGTVFDPTGTNHHLFNPFTGRSAEVNKADTVVAKDATTADALSTAFSIMPIKKSADILKSSFKGRAIIHKNDNTSVVLTSPS